MKDFFFILKALKQSEVGCVGTHVKAPMTFSLFVGVLEKATGNDYENDVGEKNIVSSVKENCTHCIKLPVHSCVCKNGNHKSNINVPF